MAIGICRQRDREGGVKKREIIFLEKGRESEKERKVGMGKKETEEEVNEEDMGGER